MSRKIRNPSGFAQPKVKSGKRRLKRIFPHSLKNPIPIYVGDSETWRHAHNPVFWCIKGLDFEEYKMWDSSEINLIRKWFFKGKKKIVFFHNLEFDLATFLTCQEVAVARKVSAGNKIISLHFGKTEFRDSKALLVNSVAELGDAFHLPKGVTPLKFIEGNSEKGYNELDIEYCIRDIDIVIKGLKDFYSFYAKITETDKPVFPLTIASAAYRIWSAAFWPFKFESLYIDREVFDSALKCYYGGRVQVFCKGGSEHFNVFVYDINSLYPSVMIDNLYPHPKKSWKARPDIDLLEIYIEEGKLIWGHFVLKAKPNALLFLPSLDKDERRNYKRNYFDGFLCQPELIYALNNGWELTEIKELYAGIPVKPFDEYVKTFYNMRLKYQEENNPLEHLCKLQLNSLYGKFGQRDRGNRIENPEQIEKIMSKKGWEKLYKIGYYSKSCWYLTEKTATRQCLNSWPAFASFVTSYARVKLADSIKNDGNVLYCDTDSIHTKTPPENMDISLSEKLGDWKLEYGPISRAVYWEPKVYFFENYAGDKYLIRHKGANKSDGDLTKVQTAEMFVKYRTSLRRNIKYGSFIEVEKRSKRFYGKGENND